MAESAFAVLDRLFGCYHVVSPLTSRVNRNRNSGKGGKNAYKPRHHCPPGLRLVSLYSVLGPIIRQSTERFADLQLFLAPKSETSAQWDSWTPTEKTSLEASALADYNKDSIQKFYLDDGTKPFYI